MQAYRRETSNAPPLLYLGDEALWFTGLYDYHLFLPLLRCREHFKLYTL